MVIEKCVYKTYENLITFLWEKKSNKGQGKLFLPFYKFMMGVGLVFNFV